MPEVSIRLGDDEVTYTPDQHALNDAVFEAAQDLLTAMASNQIMLPEVLDAPFHTFVSAVDLALGFDPQQEK